MVSKLRNHLKKYLFLILLIIIYIMIYFEDYVRFKDIIQLFDLNFLQQFLVLPPILFIIGLSKIWIQKDTMIKLLGENSGFKGVVIAFLVGTVGIGPLYVAFPIAAMFYKKGASYRNTYILMGSWSTTKLTQIVFELQSLGFLYTLLRLGLNVISIICIAVLMDATTSLKVKNSLEAER